MTGLIFVLAGCACAGGPAPAVTVPLVDGWHFRADPQGTGATQGRAGVDYDDRTWRGKYASLRVRNNFVTELLRAAIAAGGQRVFLNPRAGWVFFAATAGSGKQAPRLYVDHARQPLVWRPEPCSGALEAMQYLEEGEHRVRLESDSPWTLDIRAVPELAYCYYGANPLLAEQGPYSRAFLARHVLPHVNTLVVGGKPPAAEFQQWLREGRRWVSNAGLPGLSSRTPPTADAVFKVWARNPGVTQTGYAGLIVDEFVSKGAGHYRAWSGAVRRLHGLPGFQKRTFYAWCGSLFRQPHSLQFSNLLVGQNDRLCWERYLDEEPTLRAARLAITREIVQPAAAWREKTPNLLPHLTVCLGYLSAPPESLNTNPGVNYHVFKDMQIHRLATDPTFWGLSGLMDYSASYADEEALRWTHRMFRHYGIEGSREPLIHAPYILPHLANPDFAAGTTAWQVEAAAPGSVRPGTMDGFSWLQGRYPRTKAGDQFLVLTRSAKKPNRLRQQVRKLVPGRLYSLKLIAADLGTLDRKQQLALAVTIGHATRSTEYSFRSVYPSNYAHKLGTYNARHPAYFNYFRIVFRPAKTESMLTISDWLAAGRVGGPVGQKIALNFVEVQPFLAPE